MSEQPLIYWFETGGRRWRVREVKGSEAITRPFRFELTFRLDAGESFDPDAVVAGDAALELWRGEIVRRIDAIVMSSDVTAQLTGVPEIRVVIEPRLALARERVDIRLFRDKTAPEIVVEVLSALRIKTELRLAEVYERRPYCVQHRESDLDFVQRLLEDEGIFYYFLPGDVMVLGDSPAAYLPVPGASALPFRGGLGMDHQDDDAIIAAGSRARLTPRKVTLRDFNPDTPKLDMQVEAATRCPGGPEWYDYPGEYPAPAIGQRKARLRAEAIDCASASLKGRSLCGRLMPGCTFTLLGPPPPVESRGYVITRVEHAWRLERGGFSNAFEALDDDIAFRPPLETVAPTLVNPVTGFVTGPPGEDVYTDEWGRVKVHFHWDRLFPEDDTCSHWIPVLQDNTGQSVAIPRVGWEVLVHFLEGDPDRPVVLGRVYNAEDVFPYALPQYKSRAALKSLSSPREDDVRTTGSNLIELEDLAGKEMVRYQAERDQTVIVANDKREEIISYEQHRVDRDERITIVGNSTVTVTADVRQTVSQSQAWAVGGDRTITCGTSGSASVTGDRTVTIGGDHTMFVKGTDRTNSAEGNLTEDIAGDLLEEAKENIELTGYDAMKLTVTGSFIEHAGQGKSESTTGSRTESVTGAFIISAGGAVATRVTEARTTTVKGPMSAHAKEDVVVAGKQALTVSAGTAEFKADKKLTLKVGETVVVIGGGLIAFKASDSISITSSGSNVQGHGTSSQN